MRHCIAISLLIGCAGAEEPVDIDTSSQGVISGSEDWDWIGNHTAANDPAYNLFSSGDSRNSVTAARAVAMMGGGCSGALIAPDLIMTADHCYRNMSTGWLDDDFGETATFFWDTASPVSFTCDGPTQNDPASDVITFRCKNLATGQVPGDIITPVRVTRVRPLVGDDLFEISYNCRCDHWDTGCNTIDPFGHKFQLAPGGSCSGSPAGNNDLYRLLSPGGLSQSRMSSCEVNNADETWINGAQYVRGFNHNCDNLRGSSGAPVFLRSNGSLAGVITGGAWSAGSAWTTAGGAWQWMRHADRNTNALLDIVESKHKFSWRRFFSDESSPNFMSCPLGYGVAGFECKGHYCDDVRMLCQPVPGFTGASRWTTAFSEEQPGMHGCDSNEVATGISCSGDNCDNMQLRCSDVGAATSGCTTTGWYSDGTGAYVNLNNRFIRRAECRGGWCDDVRFEVCTVGVTETCLDSCDGQSATGTCFCDEQCNSFGDCCADVGLMCR